MPTSKTLRALPEFVREPDPAIYWSDNYVVLDFETTTEYKGSSLIESNRIVLACWTVVGTKHGPSVRGGPDDDVSRIRKYRFGSEYDLGELVEDCMAAKFIVAHNAKFELGWLKRCGLDLRKVVVYDTLIGEYVLGGNRFNLVQLSLANSLKRYGLAPKEDIIGRMFRAGIDTTDMPESWLLSYCERDVEATEELFLKQRERLRERDLIHLQYQRCLVTPCLADIEFQGMQLDHKQVQGAIQELEDKYARKTAELQEFCGGVPPSSNPQKCDYIYNVLKFDVPRDYKGRYMVTKSGGPSVAADVVARLKPKTAKQTRFLELHEEWASLHSDVTKYMRKFNQCCEEAGGRLRAVFNQCSTRTHRLSSSGLVHKVQFQNLNRAFKPVFCSRNEGWLIGEADGAQLEFRIAAHLGRDKVALGDILDPDFDAHVQSGAAMEDMKYEELLRLHREHDPNAGRIRQAAKPDTFKPLYGGKSGTDRQMRWYRKFAERYNKIASTQHGWTHRVLADKKLRTEYGLIFYWPDCKMTQSGYILYTTNIYNYPVQGFATAEIIPLALVCAWHRMADMESFLVNTVHDSIIAELHPEETELWHEIAKTCLITDCYALLQKLYKVNLTVPLGAGVLVGSHWANKEAKNSEVTYEAPRELYENAAKEAGML